MDTLGKIAQFVRQMMLPCIEWAREMFARLREAAATCRVCLAMLSVAAYEWDVRRYGAQTAAAVRMSRPTRLSEAEYIRRVNKLAKRWADPLQHLLDWLPDTLHDRARQLYAASQTV